MNMILKSLLLLFIVVMTLSCVTSDGKVKSKNLTINVATVANITTAKQHEFSFISKPFRTSDLSFRVGGPITDFDAYVGNYYKKGDIIAQIDPRDFHIRKEQSEAKYQQAKAGYERIKILYEKANVSVNSFEKAIVECTNAKTTHETRANELNDTELTAPFDGYIGEVFIEKYQDAKATQPIVSLVDIDQLKIEFYVTQNIAFNAQDLKYVTLSFDAMPDRLYRAKLEETSKSATSNNLSYLFTVILPNADRTLLAGMSGKVFLNTSDTNAEQISIPQSALCHNPNDNNYVWVVDHNSNLVSKRGVEIGEILSNSNISISSGLKENEMVATSGLRFLSDGTAIEIAQKN